MTASLELISEPAATPIDVAELKRHVRAEDFGDDDAALADYLAAAVSHFDGHAGILGRAMVTQTWRQVQNVRTLTQDGVRLWVDPVQSIEAVTYLDADWTEQTADASNFAIVRRASESYVMPRPGQTWPPGLACDRPDALRITYVAGWGDPEDVPAAIKHALKLLVGHWYENREAVTFSRPMPVPMGVMALLTQHRRGFAG